VTNRNAAVCNYLLLYQHHLRRHRPRESRGDGAGIRPTDYRTFVVPLHTWHVPGAGGLLLASERGADGGGTEVDGGGITSLLSSTPSLAGAPSAAAGVSGRRRQRSHQRRARTEKSQGAARALRSERQELSESIAWHSDKPAGCADSAAGAASSDSSACGAGSCAAASGAGCKAVKCPVRKTTEYGDCRGQKRSMEQQPRKHTRATP
jgi:hypothetical protein